MIKGIVAKPEAGETYNGTVKSLLGFGAIIEILPGKEAMLHVSEMAYGFVEKPEDHVQVGDKIEVQVIEVRNDGKVRLSRKPFLEYARRLRRGRAQARGAPQRAPRQRPRRRPRTRAWRRPGRPGPRTRPRLIQPARRAFYPTPTGCRAAGFFGGSPFRVRVRIRRSLSNEVVIARTSAVAIPCG